MKNKLLEPEYFYKTACLFEGSLIIVALLLGWSTDINPFADLHFSETGLAIGLLATLPLVLILFILEELPYAPVQKIRYLLLATLGPPLKNVHWTDLFILSCVAGFSEELLFRGFLQPWLENSLNITLALLASNLIFALVHAITRLYVLLAMLTGLYLGISLDYQGDRNLLVPMVIHSIYDFIAFLVIIRNYRQYKNR